MPWERARGGTGDGANSAASATGDVCSNSNNSSGHALMEAERAVVAHAAGSRSANIASSDAVAADEAAGGRRGGGASSPVGTTFSRGPWSSNSGPHARAAEMVSDGFQGIETVLREAAKKGDYRRQRLMSSRRKVIEKCIRADTEMLLQVLLDRWHGVMQEEPSA